jgi:hypothetical protein
VNDVNIPAH